MTQTRTAITKEDLVQVMTESESRGTTFVSFEAETDARCVKKNRETGEPRPEEWGAKILKRSRVNGVLGYDYENSVNNQRSREGKDSDFQKEERRWGVRLDRVWVSHKGELYFTIKVERSLESPRYFTESGVEIPAEDVKPYLPKKSSSSRQGTDKEIIHREYKLSSLRGITINKVSYEIA